MTHDAFLQAILEAPEDDTPRLIYADWLEDHGEPERAEFIRVQIELARLSPHDRRRLVLGRREQELLQSHAARWLPSLPPWAFAASWHRGFVAGIGAGVGDFLRGAEELFRLC